MPAKVVIGTQWGDEGKGKIIDYLANKADIVARYQGGDNAGHTVVVGNRYFRFHLMPSGVIRGKKVMLGNGMVINPSTLVEELRRLDENGITPNMLISQKAHVIFPFHRKLDSLREESKGKKMIGTTKKGIGPAYSDKARRIGLRMSDLVNENLLAEKLEPLVAVKNKELADYGEEPIDYDALLEEYTFYGKQLAKYTGNVSLTINKALDKKKKVLIEGAQATHLDIDHGTYPFVTSSSTIAGGACTGLGIGPTKINEVIGVTKAYTTRVGEGTFPTELTDQTGEDLREQGGEYGTTTGRPRRCGWFDSILVKYSIMINNIDWIALTKLDVLTGIKPLKICVKYKHMLTGEITKDFPATLEGLYNYEPVYEKAKNWTEKDWKKNKLSTKPRAYVKKIEKLCGVPIKIVSMGPHRKETLILKE